MSTDSAGAAPLQRGLLLMEQRRYGDAARYLREALLHNPQNAQAFRSLALCQLHLPEEKSQALETIGRALACEPNEAHNHAVQSHILAYLDRDREALEAARRALALDPSSLFAAQTETQALIGLRQWPEAEAAARRALALDPDDQTSANQLAHTLRLQNKMAENAERISWLLERDPDDPDTHTTAGWAALQRGEHRVAEEHFSQALRLEPESGSAREGLLESFRARSPLYRFYLAYSFRMARLSQKAQRVALIAVYLGVRFARAFLTGPFAPLAKILGFLYLLFVFWIWVARGVGNFILLFDRFAKHALRPAEKQEAKFVGGCLVAGLLCLFASFIPFEYSSFGLLMMGVSLLAATVPFSLTFTNESRYGRWLFGAFGSIGLFGALTGLLSLVPGFVSPAFIQIAQNAAIAAMISAAATTWLANVPSLRRRAA